MRIAIFDYKITRDNPIGGCHLRLLRALADEHEFTVFAVEFDNPHPERIRWIRVPSLTRPMFLLFITYHVAALCLYLWHTVVKGSRFDLVQSVESNLGFGTLSYSHFCHRGYLKQHGKHLRHSGIRGWFHLVDHFLHSLLEPYTYSRVSNILVPSRGLARELEQEFPETVHKIKVLPNAVDVERLQRPRSFQRDKFRAELGCAPDDVVFLFVALGHFERKGLPILLEALGQLQNPKAKLVVVGGTAGLIEAYQSRLRKLGCESQVHFAGMQSNPYPYFWAADAFAFPSFYETFSLVAYEAAAAGLPLIVPRLNGIEEIATDGETGFVVEQTIDAVLSALTRFMALPPEQRNAMGEKARSAVTHFNEARFVSEWKNTYRRLVPA